MNILLARKGVLSCALMVWGCGGDPATAEQPPYPSFAGCTFASAVSASTVELSPPRSYAPQCVRSRAGHAVLIRANAMHPLQGMVKNGDTPNPVAVGEPSTGWLQDTEFVFPAPGAYGFYCNVHGSDTSKPGSMTGVVYVEP